MKLFDLTGRVAVITGISRGIGRELALGFAEAGATVVGCARSFERAEKTAAEIRAKGHEALAILADVSRAADCEALVQGAVRRYGRLDIMVANAGINVKKPALAVTESDFDAVIAGNLRASFLSAQAAARQFIRQGTGGAIVINSSNASLAAFDELAPYSAAKGGIDMLVKSLAAEWGVHGIRVNAFNPGYTRHGMTAESQAHLAAAEAAIVAATPLRRVAELREMVGPALFLASDAASFVTGTILLADGGWCAL
jgi:NAD(P)-dependent dehydrogenase (short-subunit alcohol dehydrogenase family)